MASVQVLGLYAAAVSLIVAAFPRVRNVQRLAAAASALGGLLLTMAGTCDASSRCPVKVESAVNLAYVILGIALAFWSVWFLRRNLQEEAEERAGRRAAWNDLLEQFEDLSSDFAQIAAHNYLAACVSQSHRLGFQDWPALTWPLVWPSDLRGKPLYILADEKNDAEKETHEYCAFHTAAIAREGGGTELNKKRKRNQRILVQMMNMASSDAVFYREMEDLIEDHRPLLIFVLYLEYVEARRVRSKRLPGQWADLGKTFPHLQGVARRTPDA